MNATVTPEEIAKFKLSPDEVITIQNIRTRIAQTQKRQENMTINQVELGKAIALLEIAAEKWIELYKSKVRAEYVEAAHKGFAAVKKSGLTLPEVHKDIQELVAREKHTYPHATDGVYNSVIGTLRLFAGQEANRCNKDT